MEEIKVGEDKFNEDKDKVIELRVRMGLDKFKVDSVNQVSSNLHGNSKKNVGVRKAKRDVIGK